MPVLPSFLIIGAMKAGTSSLYSYLRAHPFVFMPERKELNFFIEEKNWPRGFDWYEGQFARAGDARAIGEASPDYTKCHLFEGVPARIHAARPDIRLIYIVRDPIERMRSQYIHNLAMLRVSAPIGQVLLEEDRYRLCSSYALQLDRYLEYFSREQILVLTAEDLRAHAARELRRVFTFLGVEAEHARHLSDPDLHRSRDKRVPRTRVRGHPRLWQIRIQAPRPLRFVLRPLVSRPARPSETTIPPEVAQRLRELLRPDVARLRAYLGADFDGWGIA